MRKPFDTVPPVRRDLKCAGLVAEDRTATGRETKTGSLRNFVDKGQK